MNRERKALGKTFRHEEHGDEKNRGKLAVDNLIKDVPKN